MIIDRSLQNTLCTHIHILHTVHICRYSGEGILSHRLALLTVLCYAALLTSSPSTKATTKPTNPNRQLIPCLSSLVLISSNSQVLASGSTPARTSLRHPILLTTHQSQYFPPRRHPSLGPMWAVHCQLSIINICAKQPKNKKDHALQCFIWCLGHEASKAS